MNPQAEIRTTAGELLRTELLFLAMGFCMGTVFGLLLAMLFRKLATS